MPKSSACVIPRDDTGRLEFDGVTGIEFSFALNVEADPEKDADAVNGARKLPGRVRLSVVATDVSRGAGGAAKLLRDMDRLRAGRTLCRVVTALGAWDNMLLAEITAVTDEANQCGWSGDLVFLQYAEKEAEAGGGPETSARKTNDNSSTRRNTGTKGTAAVSGTAFRQLLARSGISGKLVIR